MDYRYCVKNEWEHFNFSEAQVGDIRFTSGMFSMVLDNVQILPENSKNRDIRTMRTNELLFTIETPKVLQIVEEGFKMYDADGNLKNVCEDAIVTEDRYSEIIENVTGGNVYSIEKKEEKEGFRYTMVLDGVNDRTYAFEVFGYAETAEWNLFLSL